MLHNPKICIIYNGGAMGDFVTSLLNNANLKILDSGRVWNQEAPEEFKSRSAGFIRGYIDRAVLINYSYSYAVDSHYYNSELQEIFPDTKFYFIDENDYVSICVNRLIELRFSKADIEDLVYQKHPFLYNKKISLTVDQIKKLICRDHENNLKSWRSSGIGKITIQDIVTKDKLLSIIKDISDIDKEKFNSSYDIWFNKNQRFADTILKATNE